MHRTRRACASTTLRPDGGARRLVAAAATTTIARPTSTATEARRTTAPAPADGRRLRRPAHSDRPSMGRLRFENLPADVPAGTMLDSDNASTQSSTRWSCAASPTARPARSASSSRCRAEEIDAHLRSPFAGARALAAPGEDGSPRSVTARSPSPAATPSCASSRSGPIRPPGVDGRCQLGDQRRRRTTATAPPARQPGMHAGITVDRGRPQCRLRRSATGRRHAVGVRRRSTSDPSDEALDGGQPRRQPLVGPGPPAASSIAAGRRAGAGGRAQRRAAARWPQRAGHQLDGEDPGEVGHGRRAACGPPTSRATRGPPASALVGSVSVLAGTARRRFSATIAACVYWPIISPEFTPASGARNGGSPVRPLGVEQAVGAPLAEGADVGDRDGEEVGHRRHRRAVEVAARLDPAVGQHDRVVDERHAARARRSCGRARRCRGRRRAPAGVQRSE